MAAVLALCSAITYGIADFCGGMSAKRASATAAVLWGHLVGLLLVIATLPLVGGELRAGDLVIGATGGLAGVAGVVLLYQALSIGPMGVVAPVTALLAAAIPAGAGLLDGDRPSAWVGLGMALALVAIVLVSAEGGGSLRPSDTRGVTLALGAGLGFGLFFVFLAYTGEDAGSWPLLGARATSVTVMGLLAVVGRVTHELPRDARPLTAASGALDVTANLLYLLALRHGLLSVVAVLVSLYPVSTVVLARTVLHERFVAVQRLGMALAVPAAVLLAAG